MVQFEGQSTATERLRKMAVEPSTWRGVGGLLVTLGLASSGSVDAVVAIGAGLLSLVEVIRKESGL